MHDLFLKTDRVNFGHTHTLTVQWQSKSFIRKETLEKIDTEFWSFHAINPIILYKRVYIYLYIYDICGEKRFRINLTISNNRNLVNQKWEIVRNRSNEMENIKWFSTKCFFCENQSYYNIWDFCLLRLLLFHLFHSCPVLNSICTNKFQCMFWVCIVYIGVIYILFTNTSYIHKQWPGG